MQLKHSFPILTVLLSVYMNTAESFSDETNSSMVHSTLMEHHSDFHIGRLITMETFCNVLNISLSNCSCANSPTVCEIITFIRSNHANPAIFQRWHAVTVIYASIATISSVSGIIGNAAVIFIAYHQRTHISPCKLHIAELAVVNFIFSAVQTISVFPLYWTNTWIYGPAMCKISKSLLEMSSLLSSLFFQVIAIERYVLIVFPLHINRIKYFEQQHKHHILGGSILLVMVTVLPYICGLNIESESQRCVSFSNNRLWSLPYNWFTFVAYSCLPICVTSILTAKLIIHFTQQDASSPIHVRRVQMNKRIMLHMLLILSLFIVCTLPSRIVTACMDMVYFQSRNLTLGFQFLSYILYSLQGTLNPILYSMLTKDWRKRLSKRMRPTFSGNSLFLALQSSLVSQTTL